MWEASQVQWGSQASREPEAYVIFARKIERELEEVRFQNSEAEKLLCALVNVCEFPKVNGVPAFWKAVEDARSFVTKANSQPTAQT